MNSPSRELVRGQARAMNRRLSVTLPDLADALHNDPVAALQACTEIKVQLVDERESNGECSVSGAYHPAASGLRPTIAIGRSPSRGRRAFTALHELGHHLQLTDDDLADALFAPGVDSHALEEAACDEFAADLLLPAEVVHSHIGSRGPTADEVAGLMRATAASRSAVCVRACQLLPSPGHVVLMNEDETIFFAATSGAFPLRRNQRQTHPFINKALAARTHQARGMVCWSYRDGIRGSEMYAQSADADGFVVVVSVLYNAPWESFSPPSRQDGPQARSRICIRCEDHTRSFEVACQRCGVAPCHSCGACECEPTVQERTCPGCWMARPPRMFTKDSKLCTECC